MTSARTSNLDADSAAAITFLPFFSDGFSSDTMSSL